MFKLLISGVLALGVCGAATAGEFRVPGMRTNDVYYTDFGLEQKVIGRVVTYTNGQIFQYERDGNFTYRASERAKPQTGHYQVRDNGMICAYFDGGPVRCDTYVRSVKTTFFLTGAGQRWQVKSMVRK